MQTAGESFTVSGVPLARYAAVQAALAEPFPLDDVLANEELTRERWQDADLAWTEKLVDDEALLGRYEQALAEAQDKLTRSVEPLDGDVSAWVAFLGAVSRAPTPDEVLDRHGLGMNDLARLRRAWAKRMKADPAIEKRAADLAKRPPGQLPRLRVAPATLPKPPRSPDAKAAASPAPAKDVDAASLRAHRRFVTQTGLGPASPLLAPYLTPTATPTFAKPAYLLASVEPAPASVPAPSHAPVVAPPPSSSQPQPPTSPAVQAAAQEEAPTRTTIDVAAIVRELPFRATPSRAYMEALEASGAEPGDGSDGETAHVVVDPSLLRRKAPTHSASVPGAPLAPLPWSAPKIQTFEPEPDHLMFTVMAAPAASDAKALPFVDASDLPALSDDDFEVEEDDEDEDDEDGETRVVDRNRAIPVIGIDDPETITGVESSSDPWPFARFAQVPPAAAAPHAGIRVTSVRTTARPSHGAPAPAAPDGSQPSLTIQRHASLTVELAFEPARAAEILARYGVTAAEKRRADAAFKALFTANPVVQRAWNDAFELYRTWFLAQRR